MNGVAPRGGGSDGEDCFQRVWMEAVISSLCDLLRSVAHLYDSVVKQDPGT